MALITKTKYLHFIQCPKMLWLDVHKPSQAVIPPEVQAAFDRGNEVGDLAMGCFGEYKETTARKASGALDIATMIKRTNEWIADGTQVICEASFSAYGLFCAADILKRTEIGFDLYEVKNSAAEKDVFLADIAFQKYVIESCKIPIGRCFLMHTKSGAEQAEGLDRFEILDVTDRVKQIKRGIFEKLQSARAILKSKAEPPTECGAHCGEPYECFYLRYCKGEKD